MLDSAYLSLNLKLSFKKLHQRYKELRKQYLNAEVIKKALYRLMLNLLAAGASLILGLLSFGGMYALWPSLIPSSISSLLSVVYEGEIYTQNLQRAFDKIFTKNYFNHQLAKAFLKDILQNEDESEASFFAFQRYKLALRHRFGDKKVLDEFEAAFSKQIQAETFDESSKEPYARALFDWLHQKRGGKPSLHEQYKARLAKRRLPLLGIQLFSIITSLFMGLGTSYLLVELFTLVPILTAIPFAFWPIIITPMAAIAGIAYGLLTYNAVTNLMTNNTLLTWYRKLRDNLKQNPYSLRNIGMAITATLLFAMALTLTICTAGTWWTVVQEVPPLFNWMRRLPAFVMGVINPIITGFSAVVFNFENSSETLTMIEQLTDENNKDLSIKPLKENIQNTFKHLRERENVLQWLNPFRLALVFVILPMRYLLFVGHLFSIGVTADRIPGLSKYFSAFLGSLSEGFEDVHYFFKHTHPTDLNSLLDERLGESQGHEHNQDIPSWLIGKIAQPFYFLSALWDSGFSRFNKKEFHISHKQSYRKQTHAMNTASDCCHDHACAHSTTAPTQSTYAKLTKATESKADDCCETGACGHKKAFIPVATVGDFCGECVPPRASKSRHAFQNQAVNSTTAGSDADPSSNLEGLNMLGYASTL